MRRVLLAVVSGLVGVGQAAADPLYLYPDERSRTARRAAPIYIDRGAAIAEPPAYYEPGFGRPADPRLEAGSLRGRVDERDVMYEPRPVRAPVEASPRYRIEEVPPARRAPAYATGYAPTRPNLGGGFIEMLFTGDAPPPPRAMPAPRQAALGPAPLPLRREIDPLYLKQVVPYSGAEKPGTIIVDTPQRFLFLVQENGTALRYGIGVGRPGFTWAGAKTVTAKKEWPDWVPPKEMLERRPDLPTFMAGGPENPLGARALYLGSTLYRIHGSNEPWTIGQAVSSGCIRMRNEDVIDLYQKVKVGTRVVVI